MACVLVVEHDATLRAFMAEALRAEGLDVEEAAEGPEALRRLDGGLRPDLILMDLAMPGMSGWEFRASLLRDPDLASIPVCVVIEAGAEDETAERLAAIAALRHPFRPPQLFDMVRHCLGGVSGGHHP
ncbi:response regulator [Azospirillum sp. sgz302134]